MTGKLDCDTSQHTVIYYFQTNHHPVLPKKLSSRGRRVNRVWGSLHQARPKDLNYLLIHLTTSSHYSLLSEILRLLGQIFLSRFNLPLPEPLNDGMIDVSVINVVNICW